MRSDKSLTNPFRLLRVRASIAAGEGEDGGCRLRQVVSLRRRPTNNPVERLAKSMPPDSVDHHIVLLEHELERVIDLPTTPSHLRARLIEHLAALKARAGTQQSQR